MAFKQILAAGSLSEYWWSISALTQSDDGINWDPPSQPFQINDDCISIATDGGNVVIPNYSNNLAITTDLATFNYFELPQFFGNKDILWVNSVWILVGTQSYPNSYNIFPAKSEVAQIYISRNSTFAWEMIYTSSNPLSRFYQVKFFESAPILSSIDLAPVVIAVGYEGSNAAIKYSLDYGETWTDAAIPTNIGPIYSVGLFLGGSVPLYFWGCNGALFQSTTLQNVSNWTQVDINVSDTIVDIAVDENNVGVMAGINNVYITFDGENLKTFNYPGYSFNKIGFIPNNPTSQWLLFARSILTQYTVWTSTDLSNWQPFSNNVCVSGSSLS